MQVEARLSRDLISEASRTGTTQSWQVFGRDASRYMEEGGSETVFRILKEMDRRLPEMILCPFQLIRAQKGFS